MVHSGIDHVVILVDDLEGATEQYRKLGFNVIPGGKHPRFTHNALVIFKDGSYLELINFWETPSGESEAESHPWHRHVAKGGGIIDFAIAAPDLDMVIADADTRGVRTGGFRPGARSRPDGAQLEWRTARMQGENIGALPFLIEDITERDLRVPSDAAEHENGVRGIRSIVVATSDLPVATQRYLSLLGRDKPSGDRTPNVENAEGVYFLIGAHRIDVSTPTGDGELARHLADRGDSPYELSLLGAENFDINPAAAGNARLRIVAG